MHLVWGIDGADWELLDKLREDGRIPTIASLMDEGGTGTLRTTIPAYTGIALPTMLTGKNPGTTGMVGFQRVDGTLQDFSDTENETFWESAGRQGYSTCAVGVRTTYPPRPSENSILISGDLYTPPSVDDYTYPDSLHDRFDSVRAFHDELGQLDELQHNSNADVSRFLETAIRSTQTRHQALHDVLNETNPDLAMFWIGNADKLQHLAWDDHEVLATYYEAVDELLAETLEAFKPEVTYIVSDHGFDAVYEEELHLNTWLAREGYLQTTPLMPLSRLAGPYVSRYIPSDVTNQILATLSGIKDVFTRSNEPENDGRSSKAGERSVTIPGIDYASSHAVVANEWGVDVLASGKERERLVDQLVSELESLRIKGERVFRFVAPRENVYTERYIDRFPDVVALPIQKYHLNHTLARELTTKTGGSPHRSGYHIYNPNGVFIAAGNGVENRTDISLAAEDFGPTVLHGVGANIPEDVDGTPCLAALPPAAREQETETIKAQPPMVPDDDAPGVDEDVEGRLRDMGYL